MTEDIEHDYQQFHALEDLGPADGYIDEILEITRHVRLFDEFSEDEIRVVCRNMHCFAAPRDYSLLGRNGGHCREMECLLLVLTGTVQLKHVSTSGGETVTELAAGSLLSEVSMIDGKQHLVSCKASKPLDFAVLTRGGLNRILLQAPRLGNKILLALLELVTSRLREINHYLVPSIA